MITPRNRIIRQRTLPEETATAGGRKPRIFFGEYDATVEEEKVGSGLVSPSHGNTSIGQISPGIRGENSSPRSLFKLQ